MTDVDDWGSVMAGSTTVIATGNLNPVAGTFTIPLANVPSTTRSLLLLVKPTNVVNPGSTYGLPIAQGATSGQFWNAVGGLQEWDNTNLSHSPVAGVGMVPLLYPFYGLVDIAGSIFWQDTGGNAADQVTYWVLALPDPDIKGSAFMGTTVANAIKAANGALVPLLVEATDAAGNQQGTTAHPLYESTGPNNTVQANPYGTGNGLSAGVTVTAITSGTAQTLFAAPPAGSLLVIDTLTVRAGTGVTNLLIDGTSNIANPGIILNVPTAGAPPSLTGPMVFNEAVKVFAEANVSAIVRAKAHLVLVSV